MEEIRRKVRYFAEISYDGTGMSGWQYQANTAETVQEHIELGLGKLLKKTKVPVIGCGRTDAGVHARGYWYHFDHEEEIDIDTLLYKINNVLPKSIATHRIMQVHDKAHARFDATERSYIYRLRTEADPFDHRYAWHYKYIELDLDILNATASLFLQYNEYYPFCKLGSDVKTYICNVIHSEWTYNEQSRVYEYRITANRFLRGMIRLIVGTCIHIVKGKVTIAEVEHALRTQSRMKRDFSVPPEGLTLYGIKYPYIETTNWDNRIY